MAKKLHIATGGYVIANREDTIDQLIESPKSPFTEDDRMALQIARSELLGRLAHEFLVANKMRTRDAAYASSEDELSDPDEGDDEDHIKTKSKLLGFLGSLRSRKPVTVHADADEIEAMSAGTLGTNARFGKQGLENAQRIFETQRRADEYASRPSHRGEPVSQDELEAMTTPSTASVLKARRAK